MYPGIGKSYLSSPAYLYFHWNFLFSYPPPHTELSATAERQIPQKTPLPCDVSSRYTPVMSPFPPKYCALLGMLLIPLATVGCQSFNPNKFGMPSFSKPGTAETQQNRAVRFDPYPETDVGPETGGMRPRDYSKPLAEPLRARWPILEE